MFGRRRHTALELEARDLEAELRETDDPKLRAEILDELDEVYDLMERANPPRARISGDTILKCLTIGGLSLLGYWADKNGRIIPKSFKHDVKL